jgi:hypothetical protein
MDQHQTNHHSQHKTIDEILSTIDTKLVGLKDLVQADGTNSFWVHEGPVIKNLRELKMALDMMNDDQYFYHANKRKNDFASWVDAVLQDKPCAMALRKSKTRKAASRAVERALLEYK